MKRSAVQSETPQVAPIPVGNNNRQLAPAPANQIVVQMPDSAQLMSLVNQVLANPDAVVQQAVSLIDDQHDAVTIRERIVVYLEED
jgi:hypothetical protein